MALGWLKAWWRGRRLARLRRLRVVMYTRCGCHLCEDAWRLLEERRGRHGFALEAVDVDDDAEQAAQYGREVPVVEIGGKVRFRGVVNPHLLDRLLNAEARSGRWA